MLSNEERFWKARDQHYEPDEPDTIECPECDGDGSLDHDCGEDCCPCVEPDQMMCSECEGSGRVIVKKSRGFGMYI